MKTELLAYRKYPEPKGTDYFKNDLDTEQKVIELFDYCQILEAIVTKEGWEFLLDKYGLKKVFELNNLSGWIDCESLKEFEEDINEKIKSA
jgi:hypothetical protein